MLVAKLKQVIAKRLRKLADRLDPPSPPPVEDWMRTHAAWLASPLFSSGRCAQAPAPSLQQPDR